MKIETKTYAFIVLTLVIGMVMGALITGAVIRHRARHFMSLGYPDHLTNRIESIIEPTVAQRDTIHQILMEHAQRFHEIHGRFESQLLALKDSLKKDLDPILTEEQKERLERAPKPPGHLRDGRPGEWKDRRPGAPPPPPGGNQMPPPPEGSRPHPGGDGP